MPLIHLSTFWLIAINSFAWFAIQISIGYFATRIRDDRFNPHDRLFRTRAWEKNGKFYQKIFKVSRWNSLLPSGGKIFGTFSIHNFRSSAQDYLNKWLIESCRAECVHWVAMLPALLFFLWNPFEAWMMNIAYALCVNAPCIISQRHNRPRVLALVSRRNNIIENNLKRNVFP